MSAALGIIRYASFAGGGRGTVKGSSLAEQGNNPLGLVKFNKVTFHFISRRVGKGHQKY